jgi:hypothetical protein
MFASVPLLKLKAEIFLSYAPIWGNMARIICLALGLNALFRDEARERQAEKEAYQDQILKLNAELTQSLERLAHEVKTRTAMVEDLAHRGNNPLHATQLSLDNVGLDVRASETLVAQIFGPEEQLEGDGLLCFRQFQHHFGDIRGEVALTRKNLQRMAEAIGDIRLLGGVDGQSQEWTVLPEVFAAMERRLKENVSTQDCARLQFGAFPRETASVLAPSKLLVICLERWFRRYLEVCPGSHSFTPEVCAEGSGVRVKLRCSSAAAGAGEDMQNLTASLAYLFDQHGVLLRWQEDGLELVFASASLASAA